MQVEVKRTCAANRGWILTAEITDIGSGGVRAPEAGVTSSGIFGDYG